MGTELLELAGGLAGAEWLGACRHGRALTALAQRQAPCCADPTICSSLHKAVTFTVCYTSAPTLAKGIARMVAT